MFEKYKGCWRMVDWNKLACDPYQTYWDPAAGIHVYDFTEPPFEHLDDMGVDRGWFN